MSRKLRPLATEERRAIAPAVARQEAEAACAVGVALRDAALSLPNVSVFRGELLESAADYLTLARLRGVPVPSAELAEQPPIG
jgi:hypothetical protein